MITAANRLRKHADYQRVYKASRKRFGKQMSYFFLLRQPELLRENSTLRQPDACARIGLTVSRAMGNAVQRNRIKRRMREAVRREIGTLQLPVDVVLHPDRRVAEVEFSLLERDIAHIFHAIQREAAEQLRGPGVHATRGSA